MKQNRLARISHQAAQKTEKALARWSKAEMITEKKVTEELLGSQFSFDQNQIPPPPFPWLALALVSLKRDASEAQFNHFMAFAEISVSMHPAIYR